MPTIKIGRKTFKFPYTLGGKMVALRMQQKFNGTKVARGENLLKSVKSPKKGS